MIRKSGHRFSDKIMPKKAKDIPPLAETFTGQYVTSP
jgi:hypothetical protein